MTWEAWAAIISTGATAIAALAVAIWSHFSKKWLAATDRAWADYELRRDVYMEFAALVSALFEGGDDENRSTLHRVARRIRLVGSDDVVTALNTFTAGIKNSLSDLDHEKNFQLLFNAMRRDIRRIDQRPPTQTDLGPDAFPLES